MAIRKTIQTGNPIIRALAEPVTKLASAQTEKIIEDLVDTMRAAGLVGIAAPQIGVSQKIFVSEVRKTKYRSEGTDILRVYINPRITWSSKKKVSDWEGCGSVANSNLFAKVKKSESVIIEAKDETGKDFTLKASGLLARVIQHELDHLNGVIFTDIADRSTYMSTEEYLKMRKLENKKK